MNVRFAKIEVMRCFLLLLACLLSTRWTRADAPPDAATPNLPAQDLPAPAIAVAPAIAEEQTLRILAPGIELTTIHRFDAAKVTPNLPLRIFITKVDPRAGGKDLKWKLKVAPADHSVLKFAPTSQIAAREKATVAINGGYFAFGGAALGAVKIDGEWIRLPIKNRTALGIDEKGKVLIDNFQALAAMEYLNQPNEPIHAIPLTNLNGYPVPDSASVLTPRFGSSYRLKVNEAGIEIENQRVHSKVEAGQVNIRPNGWALVVNGAQKLSWQNVAIGSAAVWSVSDEYRAWQKYVTILGAGPRLLKNGEIFTTEKEEEFRPDVIARGPRSAFGVDKNGHWIFLVADGRAPDYSMGLTIPELAEEMKNAGAIDALCFDGGGSSTLVANNQVLNRPSDGKERAVANALLVVPMESESKNAEKK